MHSPIDSVKSSIPKIFSLFILLSENSTFTGLVSSNLASKEFWQISLAKDGNKLPLNVSMPACPIPFITPLLFYGKFQPIPILPPIV